MKLHVFQTALAVLTIVLSSTAFSQKDLLAEENDKKNWEIYIGAFAGYSPLYEGASEYEVDVLPMIVGEYNWTRFALFIEGDKLGGRYQLTEDEMMEVSLGLILGDSRNESDADALKGSGDFENIYQAFGEFSYGPEWFSGFSTLRYAPIKWNNSNYNAFLADIGAESEVDFMPFKVSLELGLTLMDTEWSKSYYGKKAGIEKIYTETEVIYFFTDNVGLFSRDGVSLLVGEAANSKYTKNAFGYEVSMGAFVGF